MSATAEKRRPNSAQRVKILERELERRQERLAAVEAEIEELEAGQQAAVAEALRADPIRSAFQRGGAPAERERKQAELEKTAAHLRAEILALQGEYDAASAEQATAELREATREAKRLSERELELRRAFGEAVAALVEPAQALLALFAARDELVAQLKGAALEQRVGIFGGDAIAGWQQASVPVIEPVRTFTALLEEAVAASTSPRASDEDQEALRELNRHRATLGLVAEQRPVSPSRQALEECYVDLREMVRTAEQAATVEPGASGQVEGLAAAGFGLAGDVAYANDGQALPGAA
jgi:hypothetical protein